MAALQVFESFLEAMAEKKHDFSSDTFSVQFMNTEPSVSADLIETDLPADLSTGNGYTALTGVVLNNPSSTSSGGTYTFDIDDEVFTASGAVGPFQYIVMFNETAGNNELIGYYDHGSAVTLANTETFTITFNASGVFTIA